MGSKKSIKKQANEREKRIAKDLGGSAVPASGSLDGAKGDVSTDQFLIDSKHTSSKSMIVTSKMLNKISKEAREIGKTPALILELGEVQLGTSKEWVCIPKRVFQEMVDD